MAINFPANPANNDTLTVNGVTYLYDSVKGYWEVLSASGGGGVGLENIVEDTTPQLGGTLDANGNTIDMGVNIISDTVVGNWNTAYSWGDHSTQGYITGYTVTQGDVTQHQAALSITESQISDLGNYLTTETNDLTSSVTWANIPDANVPQTAVTQHQAALTITESQISDFGNYLTSYTVTQNDVTQHQAALSITESQISDFGTYLTTVALNDVSNVTITSPSNGQVLKYNGSIWTNAADEGGAGGGITTGKAIAMAIVFG